MVNERKVSRFPYTTTNNNRHVVDAFANRGEGQAAVLDLSQRSLAPKLLSQQQVINVAYFAELPHRKHEFLALHATHSPYARVSGLDAPSTDRSKSKHIADYASHSSVQATNLTLMKDYSQGICNWTTDSDRSPQQLTAAHATNLNTNKPIQVIFDWLKSKSANFPANLLFTTITQLYCKTAFILLYSIASQCLTLLICSECHVLPILTTSVWLSLTMQAVATQTFIPLAEARPIGARWHNSCIHSFAPFSPHC